MSRHEPLTIIWRRTTLDRMPESWFIHNVLLARISRPVRILPVDRISDSPLHDQIVVASFSTEFAPYLEDARRRGAENITLLHLGDEQHQHDLSFYKNADLVLRNYYFEDIVDQNKVHWVPNGFALGVGPNGPLIPASKRRLDGFFAGALSMRVLSGEREEMRAAVEGNKLPFRLHWTRTAHERLGPVAYAALLRDSRFALVPGGNSPETIRLYDALECGAIPIMLRSGFVEASDGLSDPPIVLLHRWEELPEVYAKVAHGDIDSLQNKVVSWWRDFKYLQQEKIARLISDVFAM
jgi:hypothetical protein